MFKTSKLTIDKIMQKENRNQKSKAPNTDLLHSKAPDMDLLHPKHQKFPNQLNNQPKNSLFTAKIATWNSILTPKPRTTEEKFMEFILQPGQVNLASIAAPNIGPK